MGFHRRKLRRPTLALASLRLAARFARVEKSQRFTGQAAFFAWYARAGARAHVARSHARGAVIQVTKSGFPTGRGTNVRFLGLRVRLARRGCHRPSPRISPFSGPVRPADGLTGRVWVLGRFRRFNPPQSRLARRNPVSAGHRRRHSPRRHPARYRCAAAARHHSPRRRNRCDLGKSEVPAPATPRRPFRAAVAALALAAATTTVRVRRAGRSVRPTPTVTAN